MYKKNSWITEKTDNILKEHYPIGGSLLCRKHLPDIPANSIRSRANRLNLSLSSSAENYIKSINATNGFKKEVTTKGFDKFISSPAPSKEFRRDYPYYTKR